MSNIHNKFIAVTISVMMILGCINYPVFAAVSKDKSVGNTTEVDISEKPESIPVKDIKELSGRIQSIKDNSVKGISAVKKPRMRSMLQTATIDSSVNHPPVAGLRYAILNPESLKNDQFTTETEIAWLWSYDGQDFSYDPDGDEITMDYYGIPKGYEIYRLADNTTGKEVGFVTKLSQARDYEMTFTVTDSKGASSSDPWSFSVVTVENYQSADGTFNSIDDVHSYTIPIDFSMTPSVAFCLTRTDFGGVTADIKDSGGNIVSTLTVKGETGRDPYSAKTWEILKKPTGAPDICEYTVDIKPKDSDTGSYHFAIGEEKDIEPMISGVENAVPISYYAPFVIDLDGGNYTKTTNRGNSYVGEYIPNKKEAFFKFTGTGNMTFTLVPDDPTDIKFKILDTELRTLYDSANDTNAHRTKFLDFSEEAEKAKLITEVNTEYYLVVYTPENLQTIGTTIDARSFVLTVGEPMISGDMVEITTPYAVTTTQGNYSEYVSFNISGMPNTATPYEIYISDPNNGVSYGNIGRIQFSRTDDPWTTYSSTGVYRAAVIRDWDSDSYVPLNGEWKFRFSSAWGTTTLQPTIFFAYYFELGD